MDCPKATAKSLVVTEPTRKLREKIREYTNSHRHKLRANSLDSLRFGVGEIKARILELENLTEKDVTALVGRAKRRKHATNDDMYRLSHAFLQDERNIETFSKIPGAIHILVKELTGKDSERQLSSAECLCNLSLGQAPVCEKISSFAGSYLVTYLHTAENQLIRMCLWTIANILATSNKGAKILKQMQLLPQLWKLYTDSEIASSIADFHEDAAICLQIIALNSEVLLANDDREYVLKRFVEKTPTSLAGEYHLQIVFHTLFIHPELVATFTPSQQQYLISYSLNNICNAKEFKTAAQHLRILYSIRVLGNLVTLHLTSYSILLEQLTIKWQTNLETVLNTLFSFQNSGLTQEVLWFLKNILNYENSTNLLNKLKLPENVSVKNDVERMEC